MKIQYALTVICVPLFVGCASDPTRTTLAGSGSLFKAEETAEHTFCGLLSEFGLANAANSGCTKTPDKMDSAGTKGVLQRRRNELSFYIMALSDQRCGLYKRAILSRKASFDYSFGALSTLLAGAGAVVSHEPTAKAFSAGAGVLSGARAEFDQAYFSNLAIELITAGIDDRRKHIREAVTNKLGKSIDEYPIMSAMGDAVAYHAACSAVTGLEVAKDSISRKDNPGWDVLKDAKMMLDELNSEQEPTDDELNEPSNR